MLPAGAAKKGAPKLQLISDPGLLALARSTSSEYRLVRRAQMICLLNQGYTAKELQRAGYGEARTIVLWEERYRQKPGLESLEDRLRSGRPPLYDGTIRQKVLAFVCQYPDELGFKGLTHWTLRDAAEMMAIYAGLPQISYETVRQILKSSALKPHRFQYYLKRTDPDFMAKALEIIRLYEQHRSCPDDFDLVCIDELTGIQALQRKYPLLPVGPGLIERREFEYSRHGTRCLISAFDVGSGLIYGKVTPNRKRPTFMAFLDEVLRWRPDKELHLIMDNLNTHKGPVIGDWLKAQGGRVHIHYTPFHGSWLNMIEIWFGILKAKCIKRGDFINGDDLVSKIISYIHLWDYHFAHPFNWSFTEEKFWEWYKKKSHKFDVAA